MKWCIFFSWHSWCSNLPSQRQVEAHSPFWFSRLERDYWQLGPLSREARRVSLLDGTDCSRPSGAQNDGKHLSH
jgi:hypothetical protein